MADSGSPCFASSCKMSHFGIKPERGGRPPSDNSTRAVSAARVGDLVHEIARVLMVMELLVFSVRNAEDVMIIYRERLRSVSEGANCKISTIQPKWAIEEYARILRSWVWLSPPQPPTSVDRRPIATSREELIVGAT